MATQKVSFVKLGLKKNTDLISFEWGDQVIQIKAYLPVEEKTLVVERIVNASLDDNNFANPMRIEINSVLEIVFAYTNINFTETQKKDRLALYDLLVGSGFWKQLEHKMALNGKELFEIKAGVQAVIKEIYSYKTSVLGILEAVNSDYQGLNLDAEEIQSKIANKENVEFLKEVMDKMG